MSQILDGNYYVVSGWMINKLNLGNTELMVFAIIYGFCQHDEFNGSYHGSLQYLADFTGTTKQTIIKVLKSLVGKGYIEKSESYQNNVKFCTYKINTTVVENLAGSKKSLTGGKESLMGGGKESLMGGGKESLPNNECHDNKSFDNKNIFNIQEVVDLYNSICVSFSKVQKISDRRVKAIKGILKQYNVDDIQKVFTNAENSDFLKGNNDRNWKADFDWLIDDEHFLRVLEDKYIDRNPKQQPQQSLDPKISYKGKKREDMTPEELEAAWNESWDDDV